MRRPRRWLAVLLSLLQPGLGHLYTGRILPAVLFAAVASLLAAPLAWLAIDADPRWGVVGVTVAVPMFLAIVAIHAGGTAGEPARRFGTRLRVAAACLAFVLAVGTTSALGDAVFRSWVAQAFRMPTAAMQPTLRIGDHFYVDAWYYRRTQPQRGEVVGFRIARDGAAMHPADRRSDLPLEILVKRIVGVPGDSIDTSSQATTV